MDNNLTNRGIIVDFPKVNFNDQYLCLILENVIHALSTGWQKTEYRGSAATTKEALSVRRKNFHKKIIFWKFEILRCKFAQPNVLNS